MTATSGGETATMGGSLKVSMAAAIHFSVHTTLSKGGENRGD
jgi:hypothetical protein